MAFLKRVRRSLLLRLLLAAAVLAAPGKVAGAQPAVSESDVKAAFLYNFTKFVEWPQPALAAGGALKICILGEDPFGRTLQALTDEEVGGHRLTLVHLGSPSNLATCHVLFVSRSEKDRLPRIFEALRDTPVLTVGDTPGFMEQGGIINFLLEGSKVRFEINQEAAERVGIKISSKLLALARNVKGRP